MTDWREDHPLRGIDAPRALPPDLRDRLETELAASAVAVLPDGLDRPRPIPAPARERIEAAVLAFATTFSTSPATAARAAPPRKWYRSSTTRQWMPLAAAAVLLVVAMVGALTMTSPNSGSNVGDQMLLEDGPGGTRLGETTTTQQGGAGPAPPFSDLGVSAPTAGALPFNEAAPSAAGDSSDFDSAGRSSAQAAAPPIRVGLSGPDNNVAAGFRSYMNTVNSQGGVGGSRQVESVNPSSRGVIATVNTSLAGPLDPRSTAPRLEGPAAEEGRLRGDTFAFSAAPERLGHLLVDELYPQPQPGASVALFTGTGVYDDVAPVALEAALREKGVVSTRVPTRSGRPTEWPAAELAILAMSGEDARNWLAAARAQGYRPARGLAGMWGLADPSLATELPEGTTVITAYATPRADEAQAMSNAAGGPPSFGFVHGWATAKALALALWQSGASNSEELTRALAAFPQDDLGGLIAPYRVRPGTNSRTPEGLVLQVRGGTFVAQGGFRADPRT